MESCACIGISERLTLSRRAISILLHHFASVALPCSAPDRAAFKIAQAWRRSVLAREPARASLTLSAWQAAARRIQAQWRVHRGRLAFVAAVGTARRAVAGIVRLQALVRGAAARRETHRAMRAVCWCQAAVRAWQERRRAASDIIGRVPQAVAGHKARLEQERREWAAGKIAQALRKKVFVRRFFTMLHDAESAREVRRREAGAKRREEEERVKDAVAARAAVEEAVLAVRHAAACEIQAHVRGWLARKEARAMRDAAVHLQQAWRSWALEQALRRHAALAIQVRITPAAPLGREVVMRP